MPVGFCCENCFLHDEYTTCLKSKTNEQVKVEEKTEILGEIKIISTSIDKGLLKLVIKQDKENERTLLIDLKKYLES
jgi:hypothetical protein